MLCFAAGGLLSLQQKLHEQAVAAAPMVALKKKPPIDPRTLQWVQTKTNTQGWAKRDSHSFFVFQNKMWVLGGLDSDTSKVDGVPDYEKAVYYNDIWNSDDGITWTRVREHADFPPIRSASVVLFNNTLYMIGGWSPHDGLEYENGIWQSTDAVNWKKVVQKPPYPGREGQIVREFKGKLWLIGGVNYFGRKTFNDVWSSDDGIHWTVATTSAPWHSRWDHDVGIINGKLWLCGGMNFGGVGYGDEWSSDDGVHWNLVTSAAPWGARQGQGIAEVQGYMWLISGLNSATNEGSGDAWYTADGIHWQQTAFTGPWLGREDHGVVAFKGKLWVTGGMDSNWHWNGDVWYSTFQNVGDPPLPVPTASSSAATTTPQRPWHQDMKI